MEKDFLLEKVLKDGDPGLHKRMKESVFVLRTMLWSFLDRFPCFTDHSLLHSMSVIDYCIDVAEKRSDLRIMQDKVVLIKA